MAKNKKKKPESINYTVTRIRRQSLDKLRVMAVVRNTTVPFLIDDMLRAYQLVNGLWEGKEVKDAEKETPATSSTDDLD